MIEQFNIRRMPSLQNGDKDDKSCRRIKNSLC